MGAASNREGARAAAQPPAAGALYLEACLSPRTQLALAWRTAAQNYSRLGALVCQYTSSSCCFSSPIYLGGNKSPALRRRLRGTARRSDTDLQHKGGRRLLSQTSILQLQLSAVHRRDCITSAAYSNKRRAKRDKRCV